VGHYQWVSVAIAAGSQGVGFGEFDVFDPSEVSVLSLADGKAALRITTTANDSKILRKIASIEADIERVIGGPIVTRQVTERVELSAGYTALVLRKRPIVSVVSITSVASGGALSITDIDIDPVANIVRRKLGWPFYGPYFQPLPAMDRRLQRRARGFRPAVYRRRRREHPADAVGCDPARRDAARWRRAAGSGAAGDDVCDLVLGRRETSAVHAGGLRLMRAPTQPQRRPDAQHQ